MISSNGPAATPPPFGVPGGDCSYDPHRRLTCFDGAAWKGVGVAVMTLAGFPPAPKSGDAGGGELFAPPAAGSLTAVPFRRR